MTPQEALALFAAGIVFGYMLHIWKVWGDEARP